MTEKQTILINFFRNKTDESPIKIKSDEARQTINQLIEIGFDNENFFIETDGETDGETVSKKFKNLFIYLITFEYSFFSIKGKGKYSDLIRQDYNKWSNNSLNEEQFQQELTKYENKYINYAAKKITKAIAKGVKPIA